MVPDATVARNSAGLLAGTIINGTFAYVFFASTTRTLGPEAAAPVSVLWTYWGMSMAAIAFPVQHWTIKTFRTSGEGAVRDSLPALLSSIVLLSILAMGLSFIGRDQLFSRNTVVFPALVGLVTLASFFTGLVRGGLAGRQRFIATSISLAADNIARVLLALLVFHLGAGAVGVGMALVAGALVGLLWPSSYRFRQGCSTTPASVNLSLLGKTALGALLGQVVLTGGPALVALLGGAPTNVTMLFVTLAFFRVPHLLAVGLSNQITGILTMWVAEEKVKQLRWFLFSVTMLTIGGSVVVGFIAYWIAPALIGFVFGPQTRPPGWLAAGVGSGSILGIANLVLSLLLIAQGAGGRIMGAWTASICIVSLILLSVPLPPLQLVLWAFIGGEFTAFAILILSRRAPTSGHEEAPSSFFLLRLLGIQDS